MKFRNKKTGIVIETKVELTGNWEPAGEMKPISLNKRTKEQLIEYAREKGIEVDPESKKDKIVKAIAAAEAQQAAEEAQQAAEEAEEGGDEE